jgi:hypothetical protein
MNRCTDPECIDGPTEDDQQRPRWAAEGANLCRRCATLLERRLAELHSQADAVRATLGGLHSSRKGENRPTKGSPPVPLNLDAHDFLTEMHATVVSWVRLVTEERNLHGPDRDLLPALTSWLLHQLDWLCGHEAVGDFADEVRDLSRKADALAGTRPGWHKLPAPCPACGATSLGRWDGADEVGCQTCGERWAEQQYRWLVAVLSSDPGTSVTAAEAVERAEVPAATFRQWVSRGKVRRLGTVDGTARYSTADLDAVLGGEAS